MNKEWKEYHGILEELCEHPIENPTEDDMAKACPHLTKEEAVKAFMEHGYVACPPLRIRGAFQIISLSKGWEEKKIVKRGYSRVMVGTNYHPPRLSWSYASRTPSSYDGRPVDDIFTTYAHADKAIEYAEKHWSEKLIRDSWEAVLEIYVQDPSELVGTPWNAEPVYPTTKAVLYIALLRDLNEIIHDHSKPESQLFDEAIAEMTLDPLIWHELKGGRGGYTEFSCAYCGSGLGLSGCGGCGHHFKDDQYRCGWQTPLSKKMVKFLTENGLKFKKDPAIAQKEEEDTYNKYKKAREDREKKEAQEKIEAQARSRRAKNAELVTYQISKNLKKLGIEVVDATIYDSTQVFPGAKDRVSMIVGYLPGAAAIFTVFFDTGYNDFKFKIDGQMQQHGRNRGFIDLPRNAVDSEYSGYKIDDIESKIAKGMEFYRDFILKYGKALVPSFTKSIMLWFVPKHSDALEAMKRKNGLHNYINYIPFNQRVMEKFPKGFFADGQLP